MSDIPVTTCIPVAMEKKHLGDETLDMLMIIGHKTLKEEQLDMIIDSKPRRLFNCYLERGGGMVFIV